MALAAWGLGYAVYRGYYAVGGTGFLPGVPVPGGPFRAVNLAGAIILGIAAAVPVAVLPLWPRSRWRPVLLALCWLVAAGCCMHALIDMTERVLSLAGRVEIHYPASVWRSVDHRAADLQDLFLNEPWFLVEGLAFGLLGWISLDPARSRWPWLASAIGAVAALTVIGVLSVLGVIGKAIIF